MSATDLVGEVEEFDDPFGVAMQLKGHGDEQA